MKKLTMIVFLPLFSNICLCNQLSQRLADANKTITQIKKEMKSGKISSSINECCYKCKSCSKR